MKRLFACAPAAVCALAAGLAQAKSIEPEPFHDKKARVDGLLREWADLTEFSQTVQGSGVRAHGMIGYDDKNLYVAVKVNDKNIDRTGNFGDKDDHATLYLAFPEGRGYVTYELDLFPGQPGKSPAAVRRKGGAVAGAKIVEAPEKNGLAIEASIPWTTFSQAGRVRVGLRAALRYSDVEDGSVRGVVATDGATAGAALPPLPLEAEQGLYANLIRPKNLTNKPARVAFGNVSGDGAIERVAVYGGFLTIAGHRYRGGKEFYFGELGVSDASMVKRLELRDADGDGHDEIIVQKRFGADDQYREIIQVLKVATDDAPAPVFQHEIAIKSPDGFVQNKVTLGRGSKGLSIKIAQDEAKGFEPESYDEPRPSNMDSALLPWESVASRTFEWTGAGFEKVDEQRQEGKAAAKGARPKRAKASGAAAPDAPPPPRPPSADELQDRLYALYRKERGVGGGKPRFDFVTDVAGDRQAERVLVHDKDIVVFGKGYRGGTSYTFITVGVADSKDILDVTARDLTGDGKAEVIVRGVLHAKASKELGGDVVDRHALLIYSVLESGLARVFGAETGRQLEDNRVLGAVAFTPAERGFAIELRPARALGWTEKTYPFPPDTTTAGGLEPLLLPWGDNAPRRYRWSGSAFTQ